MATGVRPNTTSSGKANAASNPIDVAVAGDGRIELGVGGHRLERPAVLLHHPGDLVPVLHVPIREDVARGHARHPPTDSGRPLARRAAAGTVACRMSRYRFLTRPGWIIFSVVVVLLVILMLNLSAWQFRRLHERRTFNAQVRVRTSAAAAAVRHRRTARARPSTAPAPRSGRRSTVTGTFDPSRQVLIRNRSLDGAPGYDVVTPLKRADGTAVLVVRGWVPLSTSNSTTPDVPPPVTGTVTVEGRVRPTQNPGALASRDPADGVLATLARIDIPRIQQQTPYPIAPAYVEMSSSSPAPATALPVPVPLPELDDGPHLGYAVQWIIFSICAVIGWFLIVRKTVKANDQQGRRSRRREQAGAVAAPSRPVSCRRARRHRRCRRCSAARR